MKLVQAWLRGDGGDLMEELDDRFRLQMFQFRRSDAVESLTRTEESAAEQVLDPEFVSTQLKPDGPVTVTTRLALPRRRTGSLRSRAARPS